MSFTNKVVLVTGGSSGIGAATAIMFAKEGAKVAMVGRNETKLNDVAKQIAEYGEKPLVLKIDLSNEKEASTIVKKTVDHFGKLDVLVNNAALGKWGSLLDGNILAAYDATLATNLRAVIQLTSLATPYLIETKGNVVNVSSVASLQVPKMAFLAPYFISKAALDHFTRCAALELASKGVRVNSINPGPVKTDAIENNSDENPDEQWEALRKMTALGRIGEPHEIADIILFLASDRAKSVTGSIYVSDNGMLLKS